MPDRGAGLQVVGGVAGRRDPRSARRASRRPSRAAANGWPSGPTRYPCRSASGGQTSPASTWVTSCAGVRGHLHVGTASAAPHRRRRRQREADPGPATEGRLERVDRLLHQRALGEVTLAGRAAADDLADEVGHQAGVEEVLPRLARVPARGEVPGRDLRLGELDRVLGRRLDRLADAELVDQPDDDRALASRRSGPRCRGSSRRSRTRTGWRPARRSRTRAIHMSPSSMLALVILPVSRTIRTGTKLRMVPTTAVSGAPSHQCMMSMIGAP